MTINFNRLRDPYRPGNGPIVYPWIQPLRHNLLTFRRYWSLVSLLTMSVLISLATLPIQNRWRDLGITLLAVVGYGAAAFLFNLADRSLHDSNWQLRLRALRKFGVVLGLTIMHWFLPAASTELWLLYLIPMLTVGVDLDRFWAVGLIGFTMVLMFFSAWPLQEPTLLAGNWLIDSRNGAIRALIGGYVGITSYLLARSLAYQTNTIRSGLANLLDAAIAEPWLNAANKVAGVLATLLSEANRHVTVNVLVYEPANQAMRLIGSSTPAGQQLVSAGFVFAAAQGITGGAAQRGQPCFINDTAHDPEGRFLPAPAFPGIRSALAVPIPLDQKRTVVLDLESTMPNDVAYEDLQLMQHVGHYLLMAHQRSEMLDFHQRLAHLGTVLAERIIHVKEIGIMLREIGSVALDLLDADVIRFYYRDPESARIDQRCTIGHLQHPAVETLPMDLAHTIIMPLMEGARLQIFMDARHELALLRKSPWHGEQGYEPFVVREAIHACAAMPLVVGQEQLGLMWVNYRQSQDFSPALQSAIQLLAPYAALAIKSSLQSALSERNRRVAMRRIVHDSLAHRLHDVIRGLERLEQHDQQNEAWKEERMIVQCQVERARRVVANLIGEQHWLTLQSVIDDLATHAQLIHKYYQMTVKTILCKEVNLPISLAHGNELMYACDEILGNVIRHSQATGLSITAETEANLHLRRQFALALLQDVAQELAWRRDLHTQLTALAAELNQQLAAAVAQLPAPWDRAQVERLQQELVRTDGLAPHQGLPHLAALLQQPTAAEWGTTEWGEGTSEGSGESLVAQFAVAFAPLSEWSIATWLRVAFPTTGQPTPEAQEKGRWAKWRNGVHAPAQSAVEAWLATLTAAATPLWPCADATTAVPTEVLLLLPTLPAEPAPTDPQLAAVAPHPDLDVWVAAQPNRAWLSRPLQAIVLVQRVLLA